MAEKSGKFVLEVPLDASGIKDFKPDRPVKVVAYNRSGAVASSATAELDAKGKGHATLTFGKHPGSVRVGVGPHNASEEDLKHLQTLSVDVSASQWKDKNSLHLSPIPISPYYWWWWWRWCQNFTVTGRVLCADGSPVVGATVCAIDVDYWWWWTSQEQVACATTDINGVFSMTFTRCCGWWPWWWWETREWLLDPILVDTITASVKQNLGLGRLPAATATPSLGVFQSLLASSTKSVRADLSPNLARATQASLGTAIDPASLDNLRNQLLPVLPKEFPFPIWPWYPWDPWWNCNANLIFTATQVCGGQTNTIVAETVSDTRWDIPTSLNVTLTANSEACCAYSCGDNCPQGNCLVPTDVCEINVGSIGGNVGAGGTYAAPSCTAPQVGLYTPGVQDRPFAGVVDIYGTFGEEILLSNLVDYYEFQYAWLPATGGTPPADSDYAPLPFAAVDPITRQVLIVLPGPIFKWVPVSFLVNKYSDGTTYHYVIETIAHYEANHGTQTWDQTRDLLLVLNSLNSGLSNGIYYLRLMGFSRPGNTGNLVPATTGSAPSLGVPPVCDPITTDPPVNNWWAVNIDNQAAGDTDPSGQLCGLHLCTDQPIADILQVAIVSGSTTTVISGCDNVCINPGDQLLIDFAAYDPDGFLDSYSLELLYGFDQSVNLLCGPCPSVCTPTPCFTTWTLGPSPIAPSWAPGSTQVGPAYANALTQAPTSPVWAGGSYRLTVNASSAFPQTCAYLLQLYVYKRPIVTCAPVGIDEQYNLSFESFTIQVGCVTATS
jgi:hypothetical protein